METSMNRSNIAREHHEKLAEILEALIKKDESKEKEILRQREVARQEEIDKRSNKGAYGKFSNYQI